MWTRPTGTLPRCSAVLQARRYAADYSPRRTKFNKAHKGRPSCPLGGSTKGTTLVHAPYGLRLLTPTRISSAQLTSMHITMKRYLRASAKGARNAGGQIWLRVFPDRPVTSKGNETRMGKGKGAFDFWACWVGPRRVLFELGGMPEATAKEAIRLARDKLRGAKTEFIVQESQKIAPISNTM